MSAMKKFFIVGCPRSGTTLVQQALNRHSQIVLPPETKYFFSFLGHSKECQHRHVARLEADLKIRIPRPASCVRAGAEARAFFDLVARLYVERLHKRNVAYFGEKSPEHTGHLARIRQQFPDAKILIMYRDGRDVASSLTKVPWMSPDPYVNFVVWLYYYRIVRATQKSALPDTHFLRYEDVVTRPEREFRKVLNFLELPYEPAVAKGHGNREGIPDRELAWKGRALDQITTDRIGVFQRELDVAQIEILERMGARALRSLGYQLTTDGKKSLSPRFLLSLAWGVSRLLYGLPWDSLLNEWLGRSFFCRRNGVPCPSYFLPYPGTAGPETTPEPGLPVFEAS
jgi:hypothetical protein